MHPPRVQETIYGVDVEAERLRGDAAEETDMWCGWADHSLTAPKGNTA